MGLPATSKLIKQTDTWVKSGDIDSTDNLKSQKVFLYSGHSDSIIDPKVMKELETYYKNYIPTTNIVTEYSVPAEHCFPTVSYGEVCLKQEYPYIGKCAYDGAGVALSTIYGKTLATGVRNDANLLQFNQKPYLPVLTTSSLEDTGYIYVPTSCASGTKSCSLHIALHGCLQEQKTMGNLYAQETGYNNWAEANDIIVLYPYAKISTFNPANPNG